MTDYSIKDSLLQLFDLPLAVARRFRSDRLTRHAAALAFSSLLALAPLMAMAFAMLSLFSSFEQLGDSLQNFIYSFLVPTASAELQAYVEQFAGQAGQLTVVGLVLFLLTGLLLLFAIEESFNDIWRIKKGRSMTARITVYWALLSLGPILMGASLTISTYLLSLTVAAGAGFGVQVQSAGVIVLPFLFEFLAFLLLYLVMPNVRVIFIHALFGALVASILFELTKRGFTLYVVNFDSYEIVYGALSTLPIFLIWVYLSWVVALIGAEVVAVLQQKRLFEEPPTSSGSKGRRPTS
ncbi:MAG: YihY family inner membrane protein [Gammaproteobacteria bacterium]|nr:YihY family inner membrane protein [Gammaproteobacteria bacterium]